MSYHDELVTLSPQTEVRAGVAIVFGCVVLVLLASSTVPGGSLNPFVVHVTEIIWADGSGILATGPGFSPATGSQFTLTLTDTNDGFGTVQFMSASVTPEFALHGVSLPAIAEGQVGNLTVTVSAPSTSFEGPLTVNLA